MSDIGVAPEDREKLAKIKFNEFGMEFLQSDGAKQWFAEQVKAMSKQGQQQQQQQQHEEGNDQQQQQRRPQRKRSLLEECFSQTFGWS